MQPAIAPDSDGTQNTFWLIQLAPDEVGLLPKPSQKKLWLKKGALSVKP